MDGGTGLYPLVNEHEFIDLERLSGRVVFIGADPASHIRVTAPGVSGRHASIAREQAVWTISPWPAAESPVYLDGDLLTQPTPILCGSVLRIAEIAWLITAGAPAADELVVRAGALVEFCVAIYREHGTTREAASAIGMSDRTFRRRLAESEEGRELVRARRFGPRRRGKKRPAGGAVIRDTASGESVAGASAPPGDERSPDIAAPAVARGEEEAPERAAGAGAVTSSAPPGSERSPDIAAPAVARGEEEAPERSGAAGAPPPLAWE
ncbi:MAG: hypothetical protein Tsb0020_39540 [Haliangiales bacterium]